MNLPTISSELKLLLTLVDQWKSSNKIPDIEREIALDKLKMVYAQLKEFTQPADSFTASYERPQAGAAAGSSSLCGVFYEIQEEVAERLEPMPAVKAQPASGIEELVIPDFPLLTGRPKEADEQPARLTVEEASPILKSISSIADAINSSARPAEVRTEPQAAPAAKRPSPVAEPVRVEEPVAPTPKAESPRLGEAAEVRKPFVKEPVAPSRQPDVAPKPQGKPVEDIRKAISFNDKFFLIKELFKGDAHAYEATITQLNSFETLDEALIYIQENYRWDASSTAALLIVDLLQRKFI
ncbi:hypothetical protein [uncultured Acetobacteroides sp.]|uniref:hypothetical protein n=1 Tax=uncultured Acetobacteroides sp. TaxID=1760811 RepID=UPI0029F4769E|nr:hypothetical protein [uncultured Acetobacteroides sp.]